MRDYTTTAATMNIDEVNNFLKDQNLKTITTWGVTGEGADRIALAEICLREDIDMKLLAATIVQTINL
tara:strand:- start:577 stop:780 length:204 start_codon:yes stop_codon:yes gene_type:complete